MPTLLLHPRFDEDSQLLWQAAIDAKWEVVRSHSFASHADELFPGEDVAIYGGAMWAQMTAEQNGLTLLSPSDEWIYGLRPFLLKRAMRRTTLGEAADLLRTPACQLFIKSALVAEKTLPSRVYYSPDDLPPQYDPVERVIAAEPVSWASEFRAFVLDGKVLTISPYARRGELDTTFTQMTEQAHEFLLSILPEISRTLPRSAVVDVGYIEGRGWAVVEANPTWCSGIYGCEPERVLQAVAAATVTQKNPGRMVKGDSLNQ